MNTNAFVEHHLSNMTIGEGFWTLNVDTVVMSVGLALVTFLSMWGVALRLRLNPGRLQNFFEVIVEFLNAEVDKSCYEHRRVIGPFALSLFSLVLSMNLMDFLPVDLGGFLVESLGYHDNFKLVPSADLNTTVALAFFSILFIQLYAIWAQGIKIYLYNFLSHPFGIKVFPINIFFRCLEEVTRCLSLSLRLFGNMFAGELIFVMIALLPLIFQVPAGLFWALLHILVVFLQAFIFTVLVITYFNLTLTHE
jgi:F-type H+-transporting ATPase subunit a